MEREELNRKFGKNWWSKRFYIDPEHIEKLKSRDIPKNKIKEMLKRGMIVLHPERGERYVCIFKEDRFTYWTLVFLPTKAINFIYTGYPSKRDEIKMYERFKRKRGVR